MREYLILLRTETNPIRLAEAAKKVGDEVVERERRTARTKSAAIDRISRRRQFSSWLRKLVGGSKVTLHGHFINGLIQEWEHQVEDERKRLEDVRAAFKEERRALGDLYCLAPAETQAMGV